MRGDNRDDWGSQNGGDDENSTILCISTQNKKKIALRDTAKKKNESEQLKKVENSEVDM
jgi:hypothetical protein